MIAICFGNGLVLVAFKRSEYLQAVITNTFILHLACADLLVGLFMPFHMATFIYPKVLTNVYVCVTRYVSLMFTMGQSLQLLLAITIDRYLAIFWPLHYHFIVTKKRVTIVVFANWFIAALWSMIPYLWHNQLKDGHWRNCELALVLKEDYLIMVAFPFFFTIALGILLMYLRIFRQTIKIKKLEKAIFQDNQTSQTKREKRNMRLTKTAAIVLGIFYGCWLPFFAVLMTQVFTGMNDNLVLNTMRSCFTFLVIMNSAMNPIIYASRMRDFQKEFRKILHLKSNRVDSSEPSFTSRFAQVHEQKHEMELKDMSSIHSNSRTH